MPSRARGRGAAPRGGAGRGRAVPSRRRAVAGRGRAVSGHGKRRHAKPHGVGTPNAGAETVRGRSRIAWMPLSKLRARGRGGRVFAREVLPRVFQELEKGTPLLLALDAVAKATTFTTAALAAAYYRTGMERGRARDNVHVLTEEEDETMHLAAVALDAHGFPIPAEWVCDMVASYGKTMSKATVYRWIQSVQQKIKEKESQTKLAFRTCKTLSDKRTGASVFQEVEAWVDKWETHILSTFVGAAPPPQSIVNFDEVRVVLKEDRLFLKRLTCTNRGKRANARFTRSLDVASLVPFVNALGEVLLLIVVLRAHFGDDGVAAPIPFELKRTKRYALRSERDVPTFYAWTESGFLNGDTFSQVMEKFRAIWKQQYSLSPDTSSLRAFVFSDQLQFHRDPAVVSAAFLDNVHMWSLPACTSHFGQPLDGPPFANFRRSFRMLGQEKTVAALMTDRPYRFSLLRAATEAAATCLTPDAIKAGFAQTHLFPYDRDGFLENARQNLGIREKTEEDGVVSRVVNAVGAIFFQRKMKTEADEKKYEQIEVTPKKNFLHSPDELIANNDERQRKKHEEEEGKKKRKAEREKKAEERKKEAEERKTKKEEREKGWEQKRLEKQLKEEKEAAKKKEKEREREKMTCKGRDCTAHFGDRKRDIAQWLKCACEVFLVCPACAASGRGAPLFARHKRYDCFAGVTGDESARRLRKRRAQSPLTRD